MDANEIRAIQIKLLNMECSYAEFVKGNTYHIDISGGPIGSLIECIVGNTTDGAWQNAKLFVDRYTEKKERHYVKVTLDGKAYYYCTHQMTKQELAALIYEWNAANNGGKYYVVENDV